MAKKKKAPWAWIGVDPGRQGRIAAIVEEPDGIEDVLGWDAYDCARLESPADPRLQRLGLMPGRPPERIYIGEWDGDSRSAAYRLETILEHVRVAGAVVEATSAPSAAVGQSPQALLVQGQQIGLWLGLLLAHDIDPLVVHPVRWKSRFGANVATKGGGPGVVNKKTKSCLLAMLAWPELPIRGPRGGLNHDLADAVLLAHYGRTVLDV